MHACVGAGTAGGRGSGVQADRSSAGEARHGGGQAYGG